MKMPTKGLLRLLMHFLLFLLAQSFPLLCKQIRPKRRKSDECTDFAVLEYLTTTFRMMMMMATK